LEIEAKYSIPDEQAFRRLLETSSLGGFRLGQTSLNELRDRYLDTSDRSVQAAGYAYRLRQTGDRYLVGLKGLGQATGAIHRRAEYEVDLAEPSPSQAWPPGAARELALQLVGNEPLVPLFEVEQSRYSRPVKQGERTVAELSLERVRIHKGDRTLVAFLELEAELSPDGSEEDLAQLCHEISQTWGLSPQPQSKFERGLAAWAGSEAVAPATAVELLDEPGVQADDAMSEAGRKTLRFHFQRMLYHEPGTRLGQDAEALHDMRVATRRMRAAFRVFGDYFEPKAVAPFRKGLKRTGRALGPVRDLDVFHAQVHAYLAALPESQRDGLNAFLAVVEEQREAARQRMVAYLDGRAYRRFKRRFAGFLVTAGLGSRPIAVDEGEPRPYRVRHVAPAAIYQRLAAVHAYDEWVSVPHPPLERLHALRIACKRLRYTLEFFKEVLGPEATRLIKEIVAVQDHLGALQDAVVATGILREFLARGTWSPNRSNQVRPHPDASILAPAVEAYLAARQAELERLVDTFPIVWQRLQGREFSRMMAQANAVL
jgi:CHAD domain-containing protein